MAVQLDIREVTVQQVNDHGIKADGAWVNISKFAPERDVLLPSVGERVVVHLDKAGFVRRIEPIASQNVPQGSTGPIGGQMTPEADTHSVVHISPTIEQDTKGVVILRMNVMTTATAILSSGGRPTSADEVLALAGRLKVWATR